MTSGWITWACISFNESILGCAVQVSAACPFKSHKVLAPVAAPPADVHIPYDVQAAELSIVLVPANALELNKNRTRNKRVFKFSSC